jgi:pyruvoyl-dependent arginine decarboxylase (PvlArgDC)
MSNKRHALNRTIPASAAAGHGNTRLGAFHDALTRLSIGTLNLVRLTSVLPPGWSVHATSRMDEYVHRDSFSPGDLLYCVYIAAYSADDTTVSAAISWGRQAPSGHGFFAEATGTYCEDAMRASQIIVRELLNDPAADVGAAAVEARPVETSRFSCALAIAMIGRVGFTVQQSNEESKNVASNSQ